MSINKGFLALTEDEILLHRQHNRLFQEGYLYVPPNESLTNHVTNLINLSKAGEDGWINEFACPSAKATLLLAIGAELILTYKVGEDDLQKEAVKILEMMEQKALTDIERRHYQELKPIDVKKIYEDIENAHRTRLLEEGKSEIPTQEFKEAVNKEVKKEIQEIIKQRKQIQNEMIKTCRKLSQELCSKSKLEKKPVFEAGTNEDKAYLGAAGSGKSSISRLELSDEEKKDYITLATDICRGLFLPEMQAHEELDTKQVFIRTQDTAYITSSMVQSAVKEHLEDKNPKKQRPNVIVDTVTVTWSHKKVLESSQNPPKIAIAALIDIGEAVHRADSRARNAQGIADKGRFVNTSALLHGHKLASSSVLSSLPKGITDIEVYNTYVAYGQKPEKIAEISTEESNQNVKVYDLQKYNTFLNKSLTNEAASSRGDLYLDSEKARHKFTGTPEYQAASMLKQVKQEQKDGSFKPFIHSLYMDAKSEKPYAEITFDGSSYKFQILNQKQFELAVKDKTSGPILKSTVKQIVYGGIEEAFKNDAELGKELSYTVALKQLASPPKLKTKPQANSKFKTALEASKKNHEAFKAFQKKPTAGKLFVRPPKKPITSLEELKKAVEEAKQAQKPKPK